MHLGYTRRVPVSHSKNHPTLVLTIYMHLLTRIHLLHYLPTYLPTYQLTYLQVYLLWWIFAILWKKFKTICQKYATIADTMKMCFRFYTFIFWILPNLAEYTYEQSPLEQHHAIDHFIVHKGPPMGCVLMGCEIIYLFIFILIFKSNTNC
jgi:membrane protease YdiL (CAAX protease family)